MWSFCFLFSSHSFASWLKEYWQDAYVIVIMNNVNECYDCFSFHLFSLTFFPTEKAMTWYDHTFFHSDNVPFRIATKMSSSRAPPNDCAIIKKNVFLRAKNACCSCCYNTDLRARPCVRARFAKGHSLAWAFFFFSFLRNSLTWQHNTTQLNSSNTKRGFS